eukprot:7774086-Ditylum_brightwellii.AAC.1
MGVNHPRTKLFRMIKEKLGLKEKSLTAHFETQSGAVDLADAGISMPKLKQAGRWALLLVVEEYMEHSHASKKERMTLFDTKKENAASEKKAKNVETSSATKRKAMDNNTQYSDGNNDGGSNNSNSDNNDYSKTDKMGETATTNFPAFMQSNNKKQKHMRNE